MNDQRNTIRIILIIGLLAPFFEPPYFYFQLLRISIPVGLIYLCLRANQTSLQKIFTTCYIIGCILFQPIEKIALGKDLWLVVDGVFALILLSDLLITIKNKIKHEKA